MEKRPVIFATVMAGGGGTRFWPWSREGRPKQMLPVLSNRSLIRETVERLKGLVSPANTFVVTSHSHARALRPEIPQIPAENLLIEPWGRNTAPCLGWAALHIRKRNPEAVMVALPADHFIGDRQKFQRAVKAAAAWAAGSGSLVTLGVPPTGPATGYGYIRKGEPIGRVQGNEVFRAAAFREKPGPARARDYLRRGNYLWNSGLFVWRVEDFLRALGEFLPALYKAIAPLEKFLGSRLEGREVEKIYARLTPVSVDYGIMEKAREVSLIETNFPWSDVGSWAALAEIWPRDQNGNVTPPGRRSRGRTVVIDSTGCLIQGEEKLIAVLGLRDLIIVEAGGAILVCPRERAQDIRRIPEALRSRGWEEYL
ncbi:MAG: mannose-1-phosphate guanylyltransferase [Deltaproteobacteria bacterium]|nr:mannose-1-phosphate guanylyltransferase [Deltaproteobacteria bacterium]